MTTLTHEINLDPTEVSHADSADKADRTLQPREVLVPEVVNGSVVVKRRQVLCSDSYHAGTSIGGGNDHSWRFAQTSDTGGSISPGKVYMGGVDTTVSGLPATLSGVTSSTIYWIALDMSGPSATWGSGAALPANTETVEYWRVLVLTCAGGIITNVFQPYPCDIHALLNP